MSNFLPENLQNSRKKQVKKRDKFRHLITKKLLEMIQKRSTK